MQFEPLIWRIAVAKITEEILHVLKRGRAYRYRRVVPVDCRAAILTEKGEPRKNWIKTWRAGTAVDLVRREAAALSAKAGLGRAGGQKVVCVVSGGNIDAAKLATILAGELP